MKLTENLSRDLGTVRFWSSHSIATDELRKEGSKFYTQHCQLEREKQLLEKRRIADQQIMEEQVYAKLWALDLQKKEERERKEAEQKKQLVGETMGILDWQKGSREMNKQQDRQLTEAER